MFELIQQSMLSNHPDICSAVENYIIQNKPYFLTLTEYRKIKLLTEYDDPFYEITNVINALRSRREYMIMDEELFCKYIRREMERNAKHPNLTLEYNLEMFDFIQSYAHKYGIDLLNLVNMVIPEYVKYVDRIYKDHPPLIFPFSNPPL